MRPASSCISSVSAVSRVVNRLAANCHDDARRIRRVPAVLSPSTRHRETRERASRSEWKFMRATICMRDSWALIGAELRQRRWHDRRLVLCERRRRHPGGRHGRVRAGLRRGGQLVSPMTAAGLPVRKGSMMTRFPPRPAPAQNRRVRECRFHSQHASRTLARSSPSILWGL